MAEAGPSSAMSTRTRATLLVMSLCLNVGLIAFILVGIGRVGQGLIAGPGMMGPAQIARELPDAGRLKVMGIMAEHRDGLREKRRAARQARQGVFRAFIAPNYLPGDFARALDQVRAADSALEEEQVAQQRDVINALTPDERQLISSRILERRRGPWWRRLLRPNPPANP
jgi:uncharacterized membrane protein